MAKTMIQPRATASVAFPATVDDLLGQAEAMLEAPFGRLFAPVFPYAPRSKGIRWMPAVEMTETADEYVVTAEVPGLKKEDLKVDFSDGLLTVTGEKKEESKVDKPRYYAFERTYGAFQRAFAFPTGVDSEKIAATVADGLLTVHVPKVVKVKPEAKQIPVVDKK